MGERYVITGVQLGLLISANETDRKKIVDDIIDNQFIDNTINTNVIEDAKFIQELFNDREKS